MEISGVEYTSEGKNYAKQRLSWEEKKSWMGSSWGQEAAGLMMQFFEPQRADVTRAGIRYITP